MQEPVSPDSPRRPKRRFLAGLLTGTVAGALFTAAGAGLMAHAEDGPRGLHRCHAGGHGKPDPAAMRERAEFAADWMLSRVNATDAQKQQVKGILVAAMDDLAKLHESHRANRDAVVEALTADAVDRARLETLRSAELALAEQASRRLTQALADAAEVLTPEQRRALAERMQHMRGGPMGFGPALFGPPHEGPGRPVRS